ncbi:hypothetical protein EV401DRAFT_1194505 [Pisolithus croceorrhizus]|nr:hypothetical protein EV401DRAFT_1194505 [Pisolithus croceorrhizus]
MYPFPRHLPLKQSSIPVNLESHPPGGDGQFHYSTTSQCSISYANCPPSVCLYTGFGGDQCSQTITCTTVPEHFRVAHGIHKLSRSTSLPCNWQGCGQAVMAHNFFRHIRECHLKHRRGLGHANTDQMEEAERKRESPSNFPDSGRKKSDEVRDESGKKQENADPHNDIVHAEGSKSEWVVLPPIGEVDEGLEGPDRARDTLQTEGSDSGSHIRTFFQQGDVGEERESVDSHSDFVHAERSRPESDAFSSQVLAEQEDVELQNESLHSERSKLESMVLPPGEAGAERGGDPATGSYSLKIVFRQEKVGEEREEADPRSSSMQKNKSGVEVFRTEDAVTERKDPDQQNHPSHLQNRESRPDACETNHSNTNSPSVTTQDSTSDSPVWKFRDNRLSLSPGPDLEPRKTGLISKLSKFFQRRKSSQGTQEKKRTSPEILRTAPFNEVSLTSCHFKMWT